MFFQFGLVAIWFGLFFSWPAFSTSDCHAWFESAGVEKDENCFLECSLIEADMGTFHCPAQCELLCTKQSRSNRFIFNFSGLYPGLTVTERLLIADQPEKMLKAYRLTWEARHICLNIFIRSKTNDESDACRHFVWSALLYKNLGLKLSRKILNAHENNASQSPEEKSMDLKNNELGLEAAKVLLKKNKLNPKEISTAFQKNLKQGKLIVLKPGAKRKNEKR